MSRRREGRHRTAGEGHGGRHRDPQGDRLEKQHEGRHRAVALPQEAIPPLLTASGAVAAAALTALVLSGQQESIGQLSGERQEEPRPSATSSTTHGGAPTDSDIAQIVAGYAPGFGGMGTSLSGSVWDVLYQQNGGSVLALLCDGVPGGGLLSADTGASGTWTGATSVAGAQSTSGPVAASPAPTVNGSSGAGTSPSMPPAGPGPTSSPETSGTTAPRSTDGDASAEPVGAPSTGPVPRSAQPVAGPVVQVAEPVVKVVAPVTEPVVKVVAPVAEPVAKMVAPVTEPVASVAEAAQELPAP